MNRLPDEILHEIFLFIPECLFCLSCVNKRFHRVSRPIEKIWFNRLPKEIQALSTTFPETLSTVSSLYLYKKNVYQRKGHVQLHTKMWEKDNAVLILRFQELICIPPEIGQMKNLSILALQFNQLTFLPPEIGQLTNLKHLQLQHNLLTSLPLEIGQLINLEILDLDFNKLTSLPVEIGKLIHLESLWFVLGNNIEPIPLEIKQLPSLSANCLFVMQKATSSSKYHELSPFLVD